MGVDSAMRQRGVDATPVRWRGLAGLQDNAPGHTPQRKHRRCGGHRKDLPRCRWAALVATGVTVAVHLLSGRKLLWSVGIGTVCYVALLNWL